MHRCIIEIKLNHNIFFIGKVIFISRLCIDQKEEIGIYIFLTIFI